jgi:hypothetical protein
MTAEEIIIEDAKKPPPVPSEIEMVKADIVILYAEVENLKKP